MKLIANVMSDSFSLFILCGAVIYFGFFSMMDPVAERESVIEISDDTIWKIKEAYRNQYNRYPRGIELEGLVKNFIKDEVMLREARKLGLDDADPIIERRLIQKISFVVEGTKRLNPSEDEISAYFVKNHEKYLISPKYSFDHVYFRVGDDEQEKLQELSDKAFNELRKDSKLAKFNYLGHSFPLSQSMKEVPEQKLKNQFGITFWNQLKEQKLGEWFGPVRSNFGYHLVRVKNITEKVVPDLEIIKKQIIRDYIYSQKELHKAQFIESKMQDYQVKKTFKSANAPELSYQQAEGQNGQ